MSTDTQLQKNKERFTSILTATGRPGMDYVLEDIEALGFFEAPASRQGHGSYPGGLLEHSLNVYDAAMDVRSDILRRRPDLEKELAEDSVAIASLLHDVCKSNLYRLTKRKRRNEIGTYEEFTEYEIHDELFPIGHGEKSAIMLVGSGLELSDEELLAIRWHMGPWNMSKEDERYYRQSQKNSPLPGLIHVADTIASALLERPAPL